ncbi:hypothetical protein KPL78_00125 [Roseomonas sp. HJA6]|uniref:Uncharacterized protein n=1 Tax=Roseomonas alba TaxID=2846776 RepID=A0ABS7A2C7_9PROT|nr:hypothetical protein [Neoroseomonas alba]MBW6396225.1 hypothetical protein [Neoroseomonas alba]
MPHTPLAKSMMELLAHISLPAADRQFPAGDTALADPTTPLPGTLTGTDGLLDSLLAEVEEDLQEGRNMAAGTALGLVGTRLSLDATRGAQPPRHVEWLADHLRKAANEMAANQPGKALKAVRRARLALRP